MGDQMMWLLWQVQKLDGSSKKNVFMTVSIVRWKRNAADCEMEAECSRLCDGSGMQRIVRWKRNAADCEMEAECSRL